MRVCDGLPPIITAAVADTVLVCLSTVGLMLITQRSDDGQAKRLRSGNVRQDSVRVPPAVVERIKENMHYKPIGPSPIPRSRPVRQRHKSNVAGACRKESPVHGFVTVTDKAEYHFVPGPLSGTSPV
jgi:hypothetical protein